MLLFSLAALLSSCATEGNDKKQDFIVKTTQAAPVLHQGEKEFSFIAQPFRTSELSFRVGGPMVPLTVSMYMPVTDTNKAAS